MKNRIDLKQAITNLKVNEPLKVPGQPDFQKTKDTNSDYNVDLNGDTGGNLTPGQFASGLKPPGGESPPVAIKISEPRDPLTPMDLLQASKLIDYEQFAPKGKIISVSKPEKEGVFMIPHRLVEWVHECIDSKNERTMFLCLLRYSLGFWRSQVVASRTYISTWTGLDVSNVRRALKSLRDQGLIILIQEPGSHQQSAIYHIPLVHELFEKADYLKELKDPKELEQEPKAGGKSTPGQSAPEVNQPPQGRQNTSPPGGESPPKKENTLNKTKNKTLSLEQLPKNLHDYFSNLKPKTKHEQETRDFLTLLEDYPISEIANGFAWITHNGTLGKGEKVHSPMAYLAVSMAQVLSITFEDPQRYR